MAWAPRPIPSSARFSLHRLALPCSEGDEGGRESMALQDKIVVVTGGARGMGRAYVQAFLGKGAKVAALDLSWVPSGVSNDSDETFYRDMATRDDALMLTCDITDV